MFLGFERCLLEDKEGQKKVLELQKRIVEERNKSYDSEVSEDGSRRP